MKRFAEARNARVAVAMDGEILAGFCIVHVESVRDERVGYVVTLDVAAKVRRQRVASELMRQVEMQAGEEGCAAVMLHVFTGNAAAVRFYERTGYSQAGRSDGFYGVDLAGERLDALIFRKELTAAS